jgi:2-methylfumaryl-CoA hydratase
MKPVTDGSRLIGPVYGRLTEDFEVGAVHHHPWEVTLDDGLLAMFAASFLDPNPLYSSRVFARELGFRDRVVHPLVLLNLAIGYSVHDISEQALAHLAYIDVRFPAASYPGDTLTASSKVLGVRISKSNPNRGIVHVHTLGRNQDGQPVISFQRKALIPAGKLDRQALSPADPIDTGTARETTQPVPEDAPLGSLPKELSGRILVPERAGTRPGFFEDFQVGDTILHENGRTIGETEHMQLTMLSRNSHPLHFDEVYSRERSIAKTRLVCGPLVFAWIVSLASRDTAANALWQTGFDNGSHPNPVFAGDTLFAASRVIAKREQSDSAGTVRFKLVGARNIRPAALLKSGIDLFDDTPEQKVLEIEREVLLPRRLAEARS